MKHGQGNPQVGGAGRPAVQTQERPDEGKKLFVVNSISDLIAQVESAGGTVSAEARAELEKLKAAQETLEAPKRLSEAEAEASEAVTKVLREIEEKHKTSFSGRKMVIVFKSQPEEGKPNPLVSFGPEVEVVASTKRRSGGGSGFKSGGEVIHHPEPGKEVHYGSFSAMAKALGWKMEGRATASVAIEKPVTQAEWDKLDSDGRKNLAVRNRIEAVEVDGKTIQHVYPIAA